MRDRNLRHDQVNVGLSRRAVLTGIGALAGIGAVNLLTATGRAAHATPALRTGGRSVAVLGGGMAGLTAAHELAERGFTVTVYEPTALGGKARSITAPGTGTGGRSDLPGEHGFRFFPGFYQHIPDTMHRIPFPGNPNGVFDNLVAAGGFRMSVAGGPDLMMPAPGAPTRLEMYNADVLRDSLTAMFTMGTSVPAPEMSVFLKKLVMFLTSSIERRDGEWEHQTWAQTLEVAGKSQAYRTVLVSALTRQLVAARPDRASTRTIGRIGQAFVLNAAGVVPEYGHLDRLLNAPTNEAWIDPWAAMLRGIGVRFEMGKKIVGLEMAGGRISGARVVDETGRASAIEADWYVSAMPVERAVELLTPQLLDADPTLAGMRELVVDWMVGVQFFLRRSAPLSDGHVAYLGSPWALTSINQAQFWRGDFAARYGDGSAVDCLSVDISDWDSPGILYGKPAKRCSREEIFAETWAQMQRSVNDGPTPMLRDEDVVHRFLDPGVAWDPGRSANTNATPLLVNTVGSLEHRPHARTAIPNLFLAGDYIRTDIDLATMESANESARAAVNALLEAADSPAPPCAMYRLHEPAELAPMRALDAQRYAAGLPHILQT
ncbi:FAD-dependent oxidoreductase [Rhodococcus spelaei]|uniref:FAD-dependent oxidoreductase n=1 Tax=Rhodococcus spelaei TaxID=2546320 RepID=A0A541B8E6_9NOCA|nr:FAD-dependent oxidoreductase [Rhodococcus spelaei]TQF68586.1 FAD-dependent oxidoreductase [Rhodococcus spelaei]